MDKQLITESKLISFLIKKILNRELHIGSYKNKSTKLHIIKAREKVKSTLSYSSINNYISAIISLYYL